MTPTRTALLALALLFSFSAARAADDFTIPVSIEIILTPKDSKLPIKKVSTFNVLYGYAHLPLVSDFGKWSVTVQIENLPEGKPGAEVNIDISDLTSISRGSDGSAGTPVALFEGNFALVTGKEMNFLETSDATLSIKVTPSGKVE